MCLANTSRMQQESRPLLITETFVLAEIENKPHEMCMQSVYITDASQCV